MNDCRATNAARFIVGALCVATLPATLSAQTPSLPLIRDSAGVLIVEHHTIRNAPIAFRIADKPLLELGGLKDDPREELDARNPFANAARLSDGRIVVPEFSSFKMFDAGGKFIREVGRKGDGPGEFWQLRDVCVANGDTLVAINYNARRVSVFDSSGKHVRTFTVAGYIGGGACFSDGTFLLKTDTRPNPATTMAPERASRLDRVVTAQRIRMDGSVMAMVGTFQAEVLDGLPTIENTIARGRSIYAGDGRTAEIRIHTDAGKLREIIRWDDPLTRVTEKMLAEFGGEPARGSPRGESRPRLSLDFVPAYAYMMADDAGRVWIQDYFSAPEPRGWTVFGEGGTQLGRVMPPTIARAADKRVEIASLGQDYVVLRWRDRADGAVHVAFHALEPAK